MTILPPAKNYVKAVEVQGLRKKVPPEGESPDKLHTATIHAEEFNSIHVIWDNINRLGYEVPDSIKRSHIAYTRNALKTVISSYEPVTVVEDDQPSTKSQIRLNDMFIAHANEHYGEPLVFNIEDRGHANQTRPTKSLKDKIGFCATFQRTPRMPDDNRLHQLPGTLGTYDLYNVDAYADRLPENIREAGGVFFPMWQREAMWIHFNMPMSRHKWAVRVFVGRINAVSGLPMDETPPMNDDGTRKQDYVVIPGQRWLDGICVAPGVVRQFVAMPLGSGYTVEGQKTSEEKYGGLQIEIIPEFQQGLRSWVIPRPEWTALEAVDEAVLKIATVNDRDTPKEAGLGVGSTVHCYGCPIGRREVVRVADLVDAKGDAVWTAYYEHARPTVTIRSGSGFLDAEERIKGLPIGATRPAPPHPISMHKGVGSSRPISFQPFKAATAITTGMSRSSTAQPQPPSTDISTLDIQPTNLQAMGLAAGGKLVQDIYKDPYPPNIWNHAAARTIHVHILDPNSCEQVTHIVPVPPSMDAKAYADAGGQFYVVEEKVDERVEGGDFEGVKSVSQMDKQIGVSAETDFDPLKPKQCASCMIRLCDCIIRPCNHQFCNVCIKKLEKDGEADPVLARKNWTCPQCGEGVAHVAGFAAPMNLPGEEPMRLRVPVHVLKIDNGAVKFESVQKTRI